MILGFKEFFDTKKTQPTHFREKILASVGYDWLTFFARVKGKLKEIGENAGKCNLGSSVTGHQPKLHTIREDKHNRWKAGRSIQMIYRGPKYSIKSHFNKGVPELEKVISIQRIKIKYLTLQQREEMRGTSYIDPMIYIDDKLIFNISTLAKNDGFSDDPVSKTMYFAENKFLKFFNKDFEGKIIHWTNLKY